MTFERLPAQRPYIPTRAASPQCCLSSGSAAPPARRGPWPRAPRRRRRNASCARTPRSIHRARRRPAHGRRWRKVRWPHRTRPSRAWARKLPPMRGRPLARSPRWPSPVAAVLRLPAPALHQILFGDGGTEAVVVVDEFADEFMHSLLKNLVHAAVLELGAL